ncbi:MAG: Uma2 family endonuclease [Burkholderiales bacterium]
MGALSEVIEEPLTSQALAERYRQLCADPLLENIPGKIELDVLGRILMSPASNYHGVLQMRVGRLLAPLGGCAISEASVASESGVFVADVAWASPEFMAVHGTETPFTRAPELCIEIASPSNSRKALREKVEAYLSAGATEAWILFAQSKRIEMFDAGGLITQSRYPVDFGSVFD